MAEDILVLFVDDDPALRDLTAEFLERVNEAITVQLEADPRAVPERLEEKPVDCIVSDLQMPSMNGIELCQHIRRDYPMLPFFIFTSVDDGCTIERALEAGATDYIEKAGGIEHYKLLAHRISNAVQHHRARDRLADLEPEV